MARVNPDLRQSPFEWLRLASARIGLGLMKASTPDRTAASRCPVRSRSRPPQWTSQSRPRRGPERPCHVVTDPARPNSSPRKGATSSSDPAFSHLAAAGRHRRHRRPRRVPAPQRGRRATSGRAGRGRWKQAGNGPAITRRNGRTVGAGPDLPEPIPRAPAMTEPCRDRTLFQGAPPAWRSAPARHVPGSASRAMRPAKHTRDAARSARDDGEGEN